MPVEVLQCCDKEIVCSIESNKCRSSLAHIEKGRCFSNEVTDLHNRSIGSQIFVLALNTIFNLGNEVISLSSNAFYSFSQYFWKCNNKYCI